MYLNALLEPASLQAVVDNTIDCIKASKLKFHAIAVRGNSGTLIASALSLALNKGIVVVRKGKEDTHSDNEVEYDCLPELKNQQPKVLIVDDGIGSGETVSEIVKMMKEHKMKVVGAVMYNQMGIDDAQPGSFINLINKKHWKFPIVLCDSKKIITDKDYFDLQL